MYAIEIAPGVTFPDRTFLSTTRARDAFAALLTEVRMRARWEGISPGERNVHLAILRWFADHGSAPSPEDVTGRLSGSSDQIGKHLVSLKARDLIVQRDGMIEVAYPFTSWRTPHLVEAKSVINRAVCAIDALGVAAMLGTRTQVRSKCHLCHVDITLSITMEPDPVVDARPKSVTIWAGVQSIESSAVETQCTQIVFFCARGHLVHWIKDTTDPTPGFDLTPLDATRIGSAIFKPFLIETTKTIRG